MRKNFCLVFVLLISVLFIGTAIKTILFFPEALAENGGGLRGFVITAIGSVQENQICSRALGHDAWIDLYGLTLKLTGVDVIPDESRTVYRMRSGSLTFLHSCAQDFTEDERAAIKQIRSAADRVGAECWFIGVPRKLCTRESDVFAARGIENPLVSRVPVYESAFADAGFNMLDLHERMHASDMDHTDSYYRTDHHWKAETAFWAAKEIAAALGLEKEIPDISQFEQQTYPGSFLGTEGKHCGRLYCPMDDLVLYYPKFETDFSVISFDGSQDRSGSFHDALLFWEKIGRYKSPYDSSPYGVFLGGDPSKCIVNTLYPDGKHIMMIKDSYANSAAPFLSLVCRQLDLIDPRNYTESLTAYIEDERPDIVCVMLSPCMGNHLFKTS